MIALREMRTALKCEMGTTIDAEMSVISCLVCNLFATLLRFLVSEIVSILSDCLNLLCKL
jgi:hypothetical protein